MSKPHQDSGSEAGLASELRRQCEVLRMRPIPLNHMIPLMQRAADALDAAWNRRPSPAAPAAEDGSWVEMTDEDRQAAFNSLPDMLDGFLKTWGWLHFAKAIEAKCREKNARHAAAELVKKQEADRG